MADYILTFSPSKASDSTEASEEARELLRRGLWGLSSAMAKTDLQEGDRVLAYVMAPTKEFVGYGTIASPPHPWSIDEAEQYPQPQIFGQGIGLKDTRAWDHGLAVGDVWPRCNQSQSNPTPHFFSGLSFIKDSSDFELIRDAGDLLQEGPPAEGEVPIMNTEHEDHTDTPTLSDTVSLEVILYNLLLAHHNVVTEGVPGTGKTHVIPQLAELWRQRRERELHLEIMTMHPSTSYEDFVEGIRPLTSQSADSQEPPRFDQVSELERSDGFALRHGLFLQLCARALKNPDSDFLLVLDEFNRANIAHVMGDLMLALEPSKRASYVDGEWDSSFQTVLPYSGTFLIVPDNVFILATMNTSGASIAPLDQALRRRFVFKRVEPMTPTELCATLEASSPLPQDVRESINCWHAINSTVLGPCLGPNSLLGHSYFFGLTPSLTGNHKFWIEIGAMTGGSENQFNLPNQSSEPGEPTPAESFHPSRRFPEGPGYDFAVEYEGELFPGCNFKLPESERSAGAYQVFLSGETEEGDTWASKHGGALRDSIAYFTWVSPQHAKLEKLSLDDIERLEKQSDFSGMTPTGSDRAYGFLSSGAGIDGSLIDLWEFELLPQLVDIFLSHSAEDLLDPPVREAWFARYPELVPYAETAMEALESLDNFLESLGLSIEVLGSGLGRRPTVSRTT